MFRVAGRRNSRGEPLRCPAAALFASQTSRSPDIISAVVFRDPASLSLDLDTLENIEKASLRFVCQALADFRNAAAETFAAYQDLPADIGEDITREALDSVGVSKLPVRLLGKMDYKRARYVFHPDYAVRQALFVDSKAEKDANSAALQTSQTSMRIRQVRANHRIDVPGKLPTIVETRDQRLLCTTIFIKFAYKVHRRKNRLALIRIACLPNGMLQDRYNPTAEETIWIAGRNAPTRGEEFRVRLSFERLRQKAAWRVQDIRIDPEEPFVWSE